MTNPTKTRCRFTAQQRQEAVELCLSEGLSCTAVAERLGLPNSSLAKWVRQARIDRGDFGPPEQGQLTSEERAELARLRKENRELRREKDFFRLAAAHYGFRPTRLRLVDARSSCRREVSADQPAVRPYFCGLAVQAAGRGPQRLLRRTTRPSGAQGRWPQGGPPPHCPAHALLSAQGQDQTGVQTLPEPRQPGQWCGRQPAAAGVQTTSPNRCWAGDITYIRTTAGWRYLAVSHR
jgi:transposase-like protein